MHTVLSHHSKKEAVILSIQILYILSTVYLCHKLQTDGKADKGYRLYHRAKSEIQDIDIFANSLTFMTTAREKKKPVINGSESLLGEMQL